MTEQKEAGAKPAKAAEKKVRFAYVCAHVGRGGKQCHRRTIHENARCSIHSRVKSLKTCPVCRAKYIKDRDDTCGRCGLAIRARARKDLGKRPGRPRKIPEIKPEEFDLLDAKGVPVPEDDADKKTIVDLLNAMTDLQLAGVYHSLTREKKATILHSTPHGLELLILDEGATGADQKTRSPSHEPDHK